MPRSDRTRLVSLASDERIKRHRRQRWERVVKSRIWGGFPKGFSGCTTGLPLNIGITDSGSLFSRCVTFAFGRYDAFLFQAVLQKIRATSVRISVLSELHLAQDDEPYRPPPVDADVVVLPGNVDLGDRGFTWALETFPDTEVVYVLGTHEYDHHSAPAFASELKQRAEGSPIHILENSEVEIGGVTFLGCTLWTDFRLFGREKMPQCIDYLLPRLNWFKLIHGDTDGKKESLLNTVDVYLMYDRSRRWLDERLKALNGPTVVVTNHAPCTRSIPDDLRGTFRAASLVVDLDDFVADANVQVWIHGMINQAVDYVQGSTRIVSNPRGVMNSGVGFDPLKVVEIR